MAENTNDHITIKKNDPSFPAYLDFERLRSEGIAYLGELSGRLWTDHNVHDPGITILEVLCYALIDLGYRTHLPVEDILARAPDDKTPEDNFFTPAQMLTCNPLTITDYRKLLMDINGVRNAWLEVADEAEQALYRILGEQNEKQIGLQCGNPNADKADALLHVNGLYRVYIESEDLPFAPAEQEHFINRVKNDVRNALQSHRNFCEDFFNLTILCKEDISLCTIIDLEEKADVPETLKAIIQALHRFFSPAVHYYTLQQMLDEKKKSIEEIFEGRPYSESSHGFIDTDELEQTQRMKVIHVSDVYHTLLRVAGVRSVSELSLKGYVNNIFYSGADPGIGEWEMKLAKNHLPRLSLPYSQIILRKGNATFRFDRNNFRNVFNPAFLNNTKVLYKLPSPYLDQATPNGTYRSDLADPSVHIHSSIHPVRHCGPL